MRQFVILTLFVASVCPGTVGAVEPSRPNILWISSEDHGPEMGCYGDPNATTPNVDALAARGMRYARCWSNAPVCAPARTTIITGMYPQSLGAEHMRSMVSMPEGTRLFPAYLRDAGYYCTNNVKEDYNVRATEKVWDESSRNAHYKNRAGAQPFFAVINTTVSHESTIRKHQGRTDHDPASMRVPAYHPDNEIVRRDWAIYYDSVTAADADAGKALRELEEAGLHESTIVFYWGDHGSGMPRSKRWPCNSGLHVPLVVYIPEAFAHLRPEEYQPGGVSDRLVSFVDFAPTVLSLAGIEPPAHFQGHAFLGEHIAEPQNFVHGFRGRMDERLDFVRSVTDGRYVYLRNFMPHRSQAQHVSYQFETPTTAEWRRLYDAGKLNAAQSRFWQEPKDAEELYDLKSDRDEIHNLASSADHQAVLKRMRDAQRSLAMRIVDLGFIPEGQRFEFAVEMSPYDWARLPEAYDVEQAYAWADQATRGTMPMDEVTSMLDDKNPLARYWGTIAVLVRGESAVSVQSEKLVSLLDDFWPEVRVNSARALVRYGEPSQANEALATLLPLANWKNNSVFTSMLALDALGAATVDLKPYRSQIVALPVKGDAPDGRYDSYVPRLVEAVREKIGEPKTAN